MKEETKEVVAAEEIKNGIVYISPELKKEILEILSDRPYEEVSAFIESGGLDPEGENSNKMWTAEGFKALFSYIQKLPWKDIANIMKKVKENTSDDIKYFMPKEVLKENNK